MRGVDEIDADDALFLFEVGEGVLGEEVLQHVQTVEELLVSAGAGDVAQAQVFVRHQVQPEVLDGAQQFGDRRVGRHGDAGPARC